MTHTNELTIPLPVRFEDDPRVYHLVSCPYLGLEDDPATATFLPGPRNHCHRVSTSTAVRRYHQRTHCLTTRHKTCTIYRCGSLAIEPQAFRDELSLPRPVNFFPEGRLTFALLLLSSLCILAGFFWLV